jgi:hypothetical protein
MAGTIIVLVITLVVHLLVAVAAQVATFFLARRNGQHVKSTSWSPVHGFTAAFFEPKDRSAETDN